MMTNWSWHDTETLTSSTLLSVQTQLRHLTIIMDSASRMTTMMLGSRTGSIYSHWHPQLYLNLLPTPAIISCQPTAERLWGQHQGICKHTHPTSHKYHMANHITTRFDFNLLSRHHRGYRERHQGKLISTILPFNNSRTHRPSVESNNGS